LKTYVFAQMDSMVNFVKQQVPRWRITLMKQMKWKTMTMMTILKEKINVAKKQAVRNAEKGAASSGARNAFLDSREQREEDADPRTAKLKTVKCVSREVEDAGSVNLVSRKLTTNISV